MKQFISSLLSIFLIIIIFTPFIKVNAEDITSTEVITYMKDNNIFAEKEYFSLFGRILNGNDEYNIDQFTYTLKQEDSKVTINVSLNDKDKGNITYETTLNINENQISYTNNNEIDSLESRIDTILFTELVYSIGGARGYNKDVLVNWMNQIDLDNLTNESGIEATIEKVKYTYQAGEAKYDYTVNIPKQYTIDINKLTQNIPVTDYVQIKELKKSVSSITLSVYAEGHLNEECDIYRLNDNQKYEKVGTTSCNNGEFTDKNLKDNTTYTYQAAIKNEINCSDTKKITTDEIPLTGATICIGILLILSAIGIILFIVYKKYNLYKKV